MDRFERKGISFAGNMLVDVVKNVDCYPEQGMLANISSLSRAVGGCVPNTAIDLSVIDDSISLSVFDRIGQDSYGDFILSSLERRGIDCTGVVRSEDTATSFTDVMNLPSGERTFFHFPGANAMFSPEDVDLSSIRGRILHVGYLMLLKRFDEKDPQCGTVMARFLRDVQASGIQTSIDAVSSSSSDYAAIIRPSLHYCDYVIMNEIECCRAWDIDPYPSARLDIDMIWKAMCLTMNAGVGRKVIVHCREAGFCLDRSGEFTVVPSLEIPESVIKGSVGAGDAFAAGCLYGIYHHLPDREILKFASQAAACSLFSETSVGGMQDRNEIMRLEELYQRKKLDPTQTVGF